MAVKEGERLFPFCLMDQNGEEVCSESFSGSWVVLFAYVKDSTPG